jgi:hypothetical protein
VVHARYASHCPPHAARVGEVAHGVIDGAGRLTEQVEAGGGPP